MFRAGHHSDHSAGPLTLLLGLYVALFPAQVRLGNGVRVAPADLLAALFLLLAAGRLRFRRTAWSGWHVGLLLVMLVGNLVTVVRTGQLDQWVWLQKDIGLGILLAAYLALSSHVDSWERMRSVLRWFILSVVAFNLVALAEFAASRMGLFDWPWMNYQTARLAGLLIDPNAYGGLLAAALSIHLATAAGQGTALVSGWLGRLTTASLGAGLLLTFSRSAWLGLIIVGMMLTLLQPRSLPRLIATGVAALGGILLLFGTSVVDFLIAMSTRGSQVEDRLSIIDSGLTLFAQSPVIGVGLGTYAQLHGIQIHNTVIWFLVEFGLVGFVVICGFCGWYLWKGVLCFRMASPERRPIVLGLLLAHGAMLGLSLGVEALYQRHWWMVLALLAASHSLVLRDMREAAGDGPPAIPAGPAGR